MRHCKRLLKSKAPDTVLYLLSILANKKITHIFKITHEKH